MKYREFEALEILTVQDRQIVSAGLTTASDRPKDPVDCRAGSNRIPENIAGPDWVLFREGLQRRQICIVDQSRVPTPAKKITVVAEEVRRIGADRSFDSVREVEAKPAAKQARQVRRSALTARSLVRYRPFDPHQLILPMTSVVMVRFLNSGDWSTGL
jgi:hypothetical protein